MSDLPHLPAWAALLTAVLVLAGGLLCLIGSVGLLRLRTFYQRVHAPTLGTTMGAGAIVLASIVCFSVAESRLVIHAVLIGVFVTMTTPMTLILLVRAALFRDRLEGNDEVPQAAAPQEEPPASSG